MPGFPSRQTCYVCGRPLPDRKPGSPSRHPECVPARRCGCPVNATEADPAVYPCPCGDHCTKCKR